MHVLMSCLHIYIYIYIYIYMGAPVWQTSVTALWFMYVCMYVYREGESCKTSSMRLAVTVT
jgi:hypothetical protein